MGFGSDEKTEGSGRTMKEVSEDIRQAGAQPKADPQKATGESGDAPATDDAAIVEDPNATPEPASPKAKTPAEMAQSPDEFLNPDNPIGSEAAPIEDPTGAAALDKPGAPETQEADDKGVGHINENVVKDMGGGGLNDVLKTAFGDFLDGKSKQTMQDQSEKIRSAGVASMSKLAHGDVVSKGSFQGVTYQIEEKGFGGFVFYALGKTDGEKYMSSKAAEAACKAWITKQKGSG